MTVSGESMMIPYQSHEALLADIAAAPASRDTLHLWWLGQSGFLIKSNQATLLVDPYLSDSLTRKYAHTDKPHVRMTEQVIDPRRLDFVDVITSSHNHTDHLDGETLMCLLEANPDVELVVPAANQLFAADRLDLPADRLTVIDDRQSVEVGGINIHAIPAAHETVERDERGRCRFLGYVFRLGPWTVYHSGDTVLYDGLADLLRPWRLDIALLPINGRAPERRVAGNLDGEQAARLAHEAGAKLVIPCHYEMFEFNTASPAEFIAVAERLGQATRVLKCGERHTASR